MTQIAEITKYGLRRLTEQEIDIATSWNRLSEKKPRHRQVVSFIYINKAWPLSSEATGIFFKAASFRKEIGLPINLSDRFLTDQGTFVGQPEYIYWTSYRWWERLLDFFTGREVR